MSTRLRGIFIINNYMPLIQMERRDTSLVLTFTQHKDLEKHIWDDDLYVFWSRVSYWRLMYGQLNDDPLKSMSRIRVSIGVLPTSLTKNNCSMTWEETVLREGSLSRSFPNLVGWFGYWVLQYSSRAHCDFSWRDSMWATSVRPQASVVVQ